MRLAGEVAIVTGAAQGLGAAIADALEAEGALVSRTDRAGAELALDVRETASIQRAVEAISRRLGAPTILVNNAGLNRVGPTEELPEESWADVLDTNLSGAFRCSQIVGRHMLAARKGSIVNIASILADLGNPGRAAYCASKAGVVGLTRALATEWAGRGVRVNAVCPGYARTPMNLKAVDQGLLDVERIHDRTPAGRLVSPEEVGRVVAFLASSDAQFVTGQALTVDGGYSVYGAPKPASEIPSMSYTF